MVAVKLFGLKRKGGKMSEYKKVPVSREISRLSEIEMLNENVDYMTAQTAVLRRNPELLKQYEKEVSGE